MTICRHSTDTRILHFKQEPVEKIANILLCHCKTGSFNEITKIRRNDADLELMRASIIAEAAATTSDEVHDASRAFHFAVAGATRNSAFTKLLDGLWIADVGRRLLAQRRRSEQWQDHDVKEHEASLAAFEAGDADRAAELMRDHVESAFRHWSPR